MTREEAAQANEYFEAVQKTWTTKVWMRHVESPPTPEEIKSCSFCRGTGWVHLCLTHGCDGGEKKECLHPTDEEKRDFYLLQAEWGRFALEADAWLQQRIQEEPELRRILTAVVMKVPQQE